MIAIRYYTDHDAGEAGRLIADTYSEFNLAFASPEDRALMLGPFALARSPEEGHQAAIVTILRSPICLVAQAEGEIVGFPAAGKKGWPACLYAKITISRASGASWWPASRPRARRKAYR